MASRTLRKKPGLKSNNSRGGLLPPCCLLMSLELGLCARSRMESHSSATISMSFLLAVEAEVIRHLHFAVRRDLHVRRFQVPVNDASFVCSLERIANLLCGLQSVICRPGTSLKSMPKPATNTHAYCSGSTKRQRPSSTSAACPFNSRKRASPRCYARG